MKITHTEIYRLSIPMEPFVIATGTMDYAQNTFIRIHTDEGIYGVGECSAFPMIVGETQDTCLVLARDFAQLWAGKDPLAIDERLAELDAFIARNTTIKSAFDMALYDIAAKHAGVPLYRFLGGSVRDIVTDITVGIASPAEMAAKALAFKKQGAAVLKVKLGKRPEEDIARIRAIREGVGAALPIRIDANQGWTFEEAVAALQGLQEFNIQFCEQPMRSYDDHLLPQLRTQTTIPIMADESCYDHRDAIRLATQGACDYINIKFSKSGGIAEALRIQQAAANHHIPCMIGGMLESRLALSAKVHFAYAAPNVQFFDMDTCMLGHLEDPVTGGVAFSGYRLSLPEQPGIGADIDPVFLQKCEYWTV
ncbi:mandelate racemase/muconate lactonizing enzyme family protein [Parapedobacter sp. 10938]|uniref:mandelate racemase/muconate lactonizing enzyme family protein n=1 Tax=Parapedobacter flavus TaxID=3110225 RepID=UPI002DBDAD44|nr:dipeptide epimerase [Parapedobacter sp. 10938]MEC3878901.1 dipeptide epimerase [Parapedobacter sp. 10938]